MKNCLQTRLPGLIATLGLLVVLGCSDAEAIRTYTVKRTDPAREAAVSSRMIAAIVPRSEEAWFFKLTGPDAATAAQEEAFEQLIRSVRFGEGSSSDPQWALPPGWTQKPGSAMRFATLEIDSQGATLECSVSKLPRTEQPLDQYLLANINRWRGQLGLPPISVSELPQQTQTIPLADGELQATVINIAGESVPGGMGMAPFAGSGGTRPPFAGASDSSSDSPSPSQLQYDKPANWSAAAELESARGGFAVRREAVFEVQDGSQRVEITITKLPPAAGDTLPNVNRWRGQIGLDALTAEQYAKEKQQIEFAGAPADYVVSAGSQQAILGVIAEREGNAWFVKLQGDKDLAERERVLFEGFVRSIRLQ